MFFLRDQDSSPGTTIGRWYSAGSGFRPSPSRNWYSIGAGVLPLPTAYDASRGFVPSVGALPPPSGKVKPVAQIQTVAQVVDYARAGFIQSAADALADVATRDAYVSVANRYRWANDLALWASSLGVASSELATVILNLRGALDAANKAHAAVKAPVPTPPVPPRPHVNLDTPPPVPAPVPVPPPPPPPPPVVKPGMSTTQKAGLGLLGIAALGGLAKAFMGWSDKRVDKAGVKWAASR